MRWKGIIFLVILVVVFFIATLIFTDKWLEKSIENTLSPMVGAKVEIDNLDLSLTDLHIKWDRIQVTNPRNTMTNLFETGTTEFDMEFIPLLSGKYIIENIRITDIRTNTPRETDGRLERTEDTKPGFIGQTMINLKEQVERNVGTEFLKAKQKVNVDSILKLLDIQSIGQIQTLYTELEGKYTGYQKILTEQKILEDAKKVEAQIKSLDLNKMKTVADYQRGLTTLNGVYTTIDSLENFVGKTAKEITTDAKSITSNVGQVDDWIKADYERAMAKAKLPQLNAENMGRLLFGVMLINRFNQYLGYVATARAYSDKFSGGTPEKESPPRLKGQDIRFSSIQDRPKFWIKQVEISGQTEDGIGLGGNVKDIVSNQKVIGKPTLFDIHGGKTEKINVALEGRLDYLTEIPAESFQLNYAGFSMANTLLSNSRLLPNTIKTGSGGILTKVSIGGENIDGSIKFSAKNLIFAQDPGNESRTKIEQIIQSIISGISMVEVTASIQGRPDKLAIKIQSNIDRIFAERLQEVVGQEIQAAKARIKSEIDKRIDEQRNRLNTLVAEKEAYIQQQIQKYDQALKDVNGLADAKKEEIEKAIAKQTGGLEKKVKDIIKF